MTDSDKVKDLYDEYKDDILKVLSDGNEVCYGLTASEFHRHGVQMEPPMNEFLCMFTPCDTGVKAVYKGVEYFFNAA